MTEFENESQNIEEEKLNSETDSQDGATEAPECNEEMNSEAATEEVKSEEHVCEKKNDSKKKNKKDKFKADKNKPDKRDEEIADLKDKLLRQQAEFVNFRNRSEKEKSQMFEVGAKSMLEKILPTIDNFERGLAMLSEEQKAEPFAQGMDKTYKQLMTALESAGVKPIEAVGQPFDPNFHNAVMHVDDDSVGENIVVEDFQKGYMYRDTVLRFSMVKVAN